jgi:hypothetical protein
MATTHPPRNILNGSAMFVNFLAMSGARNAARVRGRIPLVVEAGCGAQNTASFAGFSGVSGVGSDAVQVI